jgi:hypothetical protein
MLVLNIIHVTLLHEKSTIFNVKVLNLLFPSLSN